MYINKQSSASSFEIHLPKLKPYVPNFLFQPDSHQLTFTTEVKTMGGTWNRFFLTNRMTGKTRVGCEYGKPLLVTY